jgi:hypothetical protein
MIKKTNPSTALGASKNINKEKGLAILYAVIVSIIMLSVATSISSIALRQTKLSSTGRESQYAFFAANTGIECARYWDLQTFDNGVAFGTSTDSMVTTDEMKCNKTVINSTAGNWDETDLNNGKTTFSFKLEPDTSEPNRKYLVEVTVTKTSTSTLITSRGYNTETADAPNAVQRGLEMFYGY